MTFKEAMQLFLANSADANALMKKRWGERLAGDLATLFRQSAPSGYERFNSKKYLKLYLIHQRGGPILERMGNFMGTLFGS